MATLHKWSTTADVISTCTPTQLDKVANTTVIITGCNTGIGKTTAAALVRCGAQVIYACRNLQKATAAAAAAVTAATTSRPTPTTLVRTPVCIPCDLSSLQSIQHFATTVAHRFEQEPTLPPLSMLVLNAGLVSPNDTRTQDGVEITFGVNHLGHYYLTELLLPLLRANAPSRVVVVASDSHYKGLIVREAEPLSDPTTVIDKIAKGFDEKMMRKYGSSKLSNVLFSQWLHAREQGNGVVSASLHPGSMITTDIGTRNGVLQSFVVKWIIGWFTKNADQGAATTLHCCLMDHDRLQGGYFDNCHRKPASVLTRGEDGRRAGVALHEASQQLIRSLL